VPLALGFARSVPPCSERFLPKSEINDVTAEPDDGWSPGIVWAPEEGITTVWMVVTDNVLTEIRLDRPAELPSCGGEPSDWLPPG